MITLWSLRVQHWKTAMEERTEFTISNFLPAVERKVDEEVNLFLIFLTKGKNSFNFCFELTRGKPK